MKTVRIVACAIVLIALGLAGPWPATAEGPVPVGVLLPLTGPLSHVGMLQLRTVYLAEEEINSIGGIHGHPLAIRVADTGGNPDSGRRAAERLVTEDGVVALVGGVSGAVAWAAAEVAEARHIPFLVTTAAADPITRQERPHVFRLCPPVSEHLVPVSGFLDTTGAAIKTVAILHEKGDAGKARADRFADRCRGRELDVVLETASNPGLFDYRPMLAKARIRKPDLIYLAFAAADVAVMLRQAAELHIRPKMMIGEGPGLVDPGFAETAAKAADYLFAVGLWSPVLPYPGAAALAENFTARYGEPIDYHGAEAYAGIQVIAGALKQAVDLEPSAIRARLAAADMMTVFGPVRFVSDETWFGQNRIPAVLYQWIDGRLEPIWPEHLSRRRPVFPIPVRRR